MKMGISNSECIDNREAINKELKSIAKLVKVNVDLSYIPTITTEFSYKAYARLKRSQEVSQLIKFLLRIISEISVIVGVITVVAEVFL